MVDPLALFERRSLARRASGKRPNSWWFYAKKSVALFPGVSEATAPAFLRPYYASWRARMGWPRLLLNWITSTLFHLWLPHRARKIASRYGKSKVWEAEALSLARRYFIDPDEIHQFGVEEGEALSGYMRHTEWNTINKLLNPRNWGPDCQLSHKADFYLLALGHGLPIAHTPALFLDGKPTILSLPRTGNLVLKPSLGTGGKGLEMRSLTPEDWQDEASFAHWLEHKSGLDFSSEPDWAVQERYATHPDLRAIAADALPTLRLTTMLNEAGEPEIVTSLLRFSAKSGMVIDNVTAGGAMAPVDLETGRLGSGCVGFHGPDLATHPVSGTKIAGVTVPDWEECKRIAIAAHGPAFRDYTLIGWDIGPTDQGPAIIEANAKPSYVIAQRAPRRGIDGTRFGELIAYHLAKSS